MADSFTVTQLIEKIQDELDLQEESFFDETDFIHAINDAIDDCEQEILQLYEGYFNATANINLVNGTSGYALPANIYASKLKFVYFYRNANDFYKVNKIRQNQIPAALGETYSAGTELKYDIEYQSAAVGQQIVFYPTPGETLANGIRLRYIRNAARVSLLTDVIDIPDGHPFIEAHVRNRVAKKEMHPARQEYKEDLEQARNQLRQTFTQMIPDEDETIEPDLSFYADTTDWGVDW